MEKYITLNIANNYAKALFNVSKIHNCQDVVRDQLNEFCVFFSNNLHHADNVTQLLAKGIKDNAAINKYVKNLIFLLIKNRLTKLINEILALYNSMLYKQKNFQRVTVLLPSEKNAAEKSEAIHNLRQILGHKIIVNFKVDAEILGGLIIDIENCRIDASYKNIINKIQGSKEQMANSIRSQLIHKVKNEHF